MAIRTWTFRDALSQIDALALLLAERYQVKAGDRVAIVAANSAQYALLMWATVTLPEGWRRGGYVEIEPIRNRPGGERSAGVGARRDRRTAACRRRRPDPADSTVSGA